MKRLLLALLVLGSTRILNAQFAALMEQPQFQAAEALSVTEITDPGVPVVNGAMPPRGPGVPVGNGTVVLNAIISETGKIEGGEVRRGLGYFTEVSIHAVENWTFSTATVEGKPVPSRVPVAINFHPPVWKATPAPLPPLIPQSAWAIQAEFQPVEVLRAAYPTYPIRTTVIGTVVLEATIDVTGRAEKLKVLRDIPPLTDAAKAAVGDWRFMPATFDGSPVPSKIVLAFVFPALLSNNDR